MTHYEWITLILTILSVLLIPCLILLVRATVKWTRVEDRLNMVADDLKELVHDKDKVHQEIIAQMREDRNATNRRLRWLEENLWKKRD